MKSGMASRPKRLQKTEMSREGQDGSPSKTEARKRIAYTLACEADSIKLDSDTENNLQSKSKAET